MKPLRFSTAAAPTMQLNYELPGLQTEMASFGAQNNTTHSEEMASHISQIK